MTTAPQLDSDDRRIIHTVTTFLLLRHSAIETLNERLRDQAHPWPASVRPTIGGRAMTDGSNVDRTVTQLDDTTIDVERINFRAQAILDVANSGIDHCKKTGIHYDDNHPRCNEGSTPMREGYADIHVKADTPNSTPALRDGQPILDGHNNPVHILRGWGDPKCVTYSERDDGGPCGNHARYEREWRRLNRRPDRRKRDTA